MFLFDFKHRIMAKANRELEKILDSNERKNSTDCYKIKWPIFQLHLVIFFIIFAPYDYRGAITEKCEKMHLPAHYHCRMKVIRKLVHRNTFCRSTDKCSLICKHSTILFFENYILVFSMFCLCVCSVFFLFCCFFFSWAFLESRPSHLHLVYENMWIVKKNSSSIK